MESLTVRLLVLCAGTWTSEFLGLATSRIGDEKGSVVLGKNVLEFLTGGFVDVLLVESNDRARDGLADGVDLSDLTTS